MVFPLCLPKDIVLEIVDFLSTNQQRHLASECKFKLKETSAIFTMLNWPVHAAVYAHLTSIELTFVTSLKPLISLHLDTLSVPNVLDLKSLNRLQLKQLIVKRAPVGSRLLAKITNPTITSLTIHSSNYYTITSFPIAGTLTDLSLSGAAISTFACFHSLENLSLSTCYVEKLNTLPSKRLNHLSLFKCSVDAAGVDEVYINHLEIDEGCEINTLELFRHIPYTKIGVSQDSVTDDFFTSPNLKSVTLASSQITSRIFQYYPHVEELNIGLATFTDDIRYNNPNLTTLYLYECTNSEALTFDTTSLTRFMVWRSSVVPLHAALIELTLKETKLDDAFFPNLPPTLTTLNLNDCQVHDHHLEFIGKLKLTTLNLPDNPITDTGITHLWNTLTLNELNLSQTLITDACTAVLQRFTLTTLILLETNLSNFRFLRDQPITTLRLAQLRGPELYDILGLPLTRFSFDPAIFEKKYVDLVPSLTDRKVLEQLFRRYPWTMIGHVVGYTIWMKSRQLRM